MDKCTLYEYISHCIVTKQDFIVLVYLKNYPFSIKHTRIFIQLLISKYVVGDVFIVTSASTTVIRF